jgi:hypothetical protein
VIVTVWIGIDRANSTKVKHTVGERSSDGFGFDAVLEDLRPLTFSIAQTVP